MRKISLLLCLFSVILLSSCSEDPIDNSNEPVNPPLPVEPSEISLIGDNIEFDCNSNQYTFAVNANCDYDIIIPVDWISVINTKATHTDSLKLAIAANNTYYPRKCDVIIQSQDSKVSDTLHISQEEGFNSLAKILKADKSITLFYQALVLTGMIDSIRGYFDESFTNKQLDIQYMTCSGNRFNIIYLDSMYIKYTVFCETDSVFKEKHSINTIEDLIKYSEQVYKGERNLLDNDYTNREHPLNKFISYHILPMGVSYDKLNPVYDATKVSFIMWNIIDYEDFYSPMLPHSVLKVSTPYQSEIKYLNRKSSVSDGISVDSEGLEALNGYAYHIEDILEYNSFVRTNVLNTRMRILASTLFPDVMSNGGRCYVNTEKIGPLPNNTVISFNDIYNQSFTKTDSTIFFSKKDYWSSYEYMGEGIYVGSQFDLKFKLPSVPNDGMYEIRFRHRFGRQNPKAVQFYLNDMECGKPRSFSLNTEWEWHIAKDIEFETEEEIQALDDTLRTYGYMKDVDSYINFEYDYPFRDSNTNGREIICSDVLLEANKDYYLRLKRIDPIDESYGNMDCIKIDVIEIVPKAIYDGAEREDKH